MEYRYRAIVLRKKEIGETDRMYWLYTEEAGKVQVVAKGIRKPEAKLAGQLENLSLVNVTVVRTRGMGKIAGALAEETFPSLREDYVSLALVLSTLGRFERLVDFEEPDRELFLLLSEWLRLAESLLGEGKIEKARLIAAAFLFQVFGRLGYGVEARVSAKSGERLPRGGKFFFCPGAGGIIEAGEARGESDLLSVGEHTIKLLRAFSDYPLSSLAKLSVSERELREIERAAKIFFEWIGR